LDVNSIVGFVVQKLWRVVPRNAANSILRNVSLSLAPLPNSNLQSKVPIVVAGYLSEVSGLGNAARACHDAIKADGLPVYGIDLTQLFFRRSNHPEFEFQDGRELSGEGTIILHVAAQHIPLTLARLGRNLVGNKYIIAHLFWELSVIPADWRRATDFVHSIVVNTEFVAEAIKLSESRVPVHVVPYPMSCPQPLSKPASAEHRYTVLTILNVASNFARKNPCGAISAFSRAFGDDPSVQLIIKFTGSKSWPQCREILREAIGKAKNISLVDTILSAAEMELLYESADVLLSLHRSEGLGLTMLEAMCRAIPVVATNWSANTEFLNKNTGMPVNYKLIPVVDPQGAYDRIDTCWADPDIIDAASALRQLRNDPKLRERISLAGAAHIASELRPQDYVSRLKDIYL
jgi:glycosyltransferase involved in cell wall biosynthesis